MKHESSCKTDRRDFLKATGAGFARVRLAGLTGAQKE